MLKQQKPALSRESKESRRRILLGAIGISVFAAVSLVAKSIMSEQPWHVYCVLTVIAAFVTSLVFIDRSTRRARERRSELANRVRNQSEARSVGDLIDALPFGYNLQSGDAETWEVARFALTYMLPRLSATEASSLTAFQRNRLYLVLCSPVESLFRKDIRALWRPADERDVEFRIAILKVFAYIGDRRALVQVNQLATKRPITKGEMRIRAAAITCHEAMELRLEMEKDSNSLLRASTSSSAARDTLLRSAAESRDLAPEEMLRASEPGS